MNRPWVLIDYDDTIGGLLIDGEKRLNGDAYVLAGKKFDKLMGDLGLDKELAKKFRKTIDQADALLYGFGDRNRFGRSLLKAYLELLDYHELEPSHYIKNKIEDIGDSVFQYPYVLLEGAAETLEYLREHFNVAIVTKGHEFEQRRKIVESGANALVHRVFVMDHKNMEEWASVLIDLELSYEDAGYCWAIGNSPKSDVNVPLSLGCNGIWVQKGGWAFEMASLVEAKEDREVHTVQTITDVMNIIKITQRV